MGALKSFLGNGSSGRWFPIGFAIAFPFLFGWFLLYSDGFLLAYPESEHLNALVARAILQPDSLLFGHWLQNVVQSWNPITVLFLAAGRFLPFHPLYTLWLGQSVLVGLLVFRLHAWFRCFLKPEQRIVAWILVLCNPLLWKAWFLYPSQLLLSLFLVEYFNRRLLAKTKSNVVFLLCFFGLSFCGIFGFILALLFLCFECKRWYFQETNRIDPIFPFMLTMLPAALFFVLASIESGVWGGGYLLNYSSPFSSLGWRPFLLGSWSDSVRSDMLWIANGFAATWPFFPLFGVFVWIGFFSNHRRPECKHVVWMMTAVLLVTFLMVPCMPHPESSAWYVFPAIVCVLFAACGIHGLSSLLPTVTVPWSIVIALAVGFWSMVQLPFELDRIGREVDYKRAVAERIPEFSSSGDANPEWVAFRFLPSIWNRQEDTGALIPFDIALRHRIQLFQDTKPGTRISVVQSLQLKPEWVVWFPTFAEAEQDLRIEHRVPNIARNVLASHYEVEHKQIVTLYRRMKDESSFPNVESCAEPIFHPRVSDIQLSLQWDVSPWSAKSLPRLHVENTSSNRTDAPWPWDFDTPTSLLHANGFAMLPWFGGTGSAVGIGCIESHAGELSKVGILQSDPFVLEAGRFSFYADMPATTSDSLFCLAVKQRQPFGDEQRFKKAKHIFERSPGESLMEDTFFYIQPSELKYEMDRIYGWQVVRVLQSGGGKGWNLYDWQVQPWRNRQAMWLLADRDTMSKVKLDRVTLSNLPQGTYWNFEDGTYGRWKTWGDAFGDRPATGRFPSQQPITGYEGNFFINTYQNGSDAPMGTMMTDLFILQHPNMSFRIGGGRDIEHLFVGLQVEGDFVLKATGNESEQLTEVRWDVSSCIGKTAIVYIADRSQDAWGHLLVDDIRIYE